MGSQEAEPVFHFRSASSTMAFFRKRLSSLTNRSSLPPSESPEFSENTPFAELRHRFLSGAINRDAFVACTRDKPVDHKFKIDREGRLEWTMVVHDLYPTRQGTLNLPSSTFSLSHVTAEDLKHEEALPPGPMNSLHVENYAIEGNVDKRLQLVFNVVAHLPLFPGSSVVLYRVGSTKYARKIATWVNFWLSEVPPRTWIHRSNQVTRVELKIPKIEELHALVEKFLRIELGDVLQTMNERIWKRRSDLKEQAKVAMMVKDAAWVSMFGYDWQLKDSRAAYGYGAGDADAEA